MAAGERNSSVWCSLGGAVAFGVSVALLWVLEATHQKSDLAWDSERVGKLLVSLLLGVSASAVAIVCAIRPVLSGDRRPLIWVGGVGLGWIVVGAIVWGAIQAIHDL